MGANYGSGSGQQVVTTANKKDDSSSLWIIHEAERVNKPCKTGQPVVCGGILRLEHNPTGKNLHSHTNVQGPLSGRQEVSGFGDDGYGDQGDDWQVVCNERPEYGPTKKVGEIVKGKDLFHLKHVSSECTLVSEQNFRYTNQNCHRCPIIGHMEVSCVQNEKKKISLWTMDSGFFFPSR